ncbi:MAG: peptidoglycan-binding protein [Deltaproteobacteria bacterium]|nr:peptidoglycan-binding protein [Deltaproteobacteria bacterium]
MSKVIPLFVALFLFALGGCSTFRGLQEDAKTAAYKVKGMFSKQKKFTPSNAQVRKTQQQLRARGYQPGRPDGLMGPQTISALRRYQSANGLTVTGEVDSDTLDSLEIYLQD